MAQCFLCSLRGRGCLCLCCHDGGAYEELHCEPVCFEGAVQLLEERGG